MKDQDDCMFSTLAFRAGTAIWLRL